MTLDLGWLDDLAALATHLNFSRAAEARNVTQPAFSRRIRALEEWVGCSLVERDTHRISLTPGGEMFLEASREVMHRLQQGRFDALQAAQDDAPIRFASTHALSLTFFPRWFGEVSAVIASTPMNLVADNMAACERLMLEGGAHFLLCHRHADTKTHLDGQDFETITLGSDNLVLVSGRDEGGKACHVVPGDPTNPTPFLAFDERSGIGRIIATVAPDVKTLNATTIFTSQLALVLKNLAQQGRGVAWAPLSLVREELEPAGSLTLATRDLSIPIEIVLVRSRGKLNRAAGEFWSRIQTKRNA